MECQSFGSPRPHISWWEKHTYSIVTIVALLVTVIAIVDACVHVLSRSRETEDGETLLQDTRASLMANGTIMLSDVTYEDGGSFSCSVVQSNVSIVAHLEVFSEFNTKPV